MRYCLAIFILLISFQWKSYSISQFTPSQIDSMLQITRYDTTHNKTKTFIYYKIFLHYLEIGDIDSTLFFYSGLSKNLNKLKKEDIHTFFSINDNLVSLFLMRNMPDSSLLILKRLEKVVVRKSLSKYLPVVYFNYGFVYWYIKDYSLSLKYFFKIKNTLKNNNDDESKTLYILTLNYISDIFIQLKDFTTASKYLKKAIIYSTVNNLPETKAYTLRNLGIYYLRISDYKNAEKYLLKSIKEFQNFNANFEVVFLNYNYLIEVYLETGELEQASEYLNALITIDLDTMPENFKAGFYKNMGKYFLERNIPQKSIIYFKKYIDEFGQYYYRDYKVYKYLGESHYLLNQVKLGFYFYKKSFDIMDSTYTAKLKFSSEIYKNISQENTTITNNTNDNISDIISFKELRSYYLKSYKYYIIGVIAILVILILFLIYKSLDYSRKYFVERNTVKKYHKKIKTLERSLAELDEFIEERSNMIQEEIDNNTKLKNKLKKIETELNLTLKELHQLKLEYTRTIKGPLSKLINYLDILMQKHYLNFKDNDIILEKTTNLIKRLKYLVLFRYGNKNFTVKDLSYNLVNIKDLLNLVLNILRDISIDLEYSVKENYIGNNFLVKTNEKIFGNILYSLFHYFLEETGKINCVVDLYERENKVLLTLGFYGKTFTDAEVSFVSSEEIINGITNIKERSKKNNYYKLVEIFYLLKKLEYDTSISYKENYFALTISLNKEEENQINKIIKPKIEIYGNILMLGIDEDEKILYEKILEEKSGNKNSYKIHWIPNALDNEKEILKRYSEENITFNLVIIKVKLLKNSVNKYKKFIHNLRKINKSFLDVNIIAIIEEYDEEKFMKLENYFSGVIYTPFDIDTFINILMANFKNNKPNIST